ncbi:MAG TPA: TonB-dependent receptor [Methylotenera sp.]|nr:TonB-dependent receptor [Methylotenera sp.]HPH08541.1 TonB-dependent receptor [Methylotenera sp.]HPM48674.1 TonB-dependent receptor [Methylotenera sp.]
MKKHKQQEPLNKNKPDALKAKYLGFNCTLKPISLVLFSLFASHAFAQTLAEETKANAEKVAAAEQTNIEQSTAKAASKLPSATDGYNIKKETLLAAESSDSKLSDEPNKVNSPNKDKAIVSAPIKADKDAIELQKINIRAKRFYEVGPMPGLGLTKEEIPGNVQSITAKEIKQSHALSLTDLMNTHLQSVNVNDYQSNPFQMDVQYRGFTASPQLGTAQGISVFLDGIRVNEPFGDVVNWDMIPLNALVGLDVFPGSNPIFGLGTLGGALAMRTKSGFEGQSLDAEILTGSFGRKQLQISAGDTNGIIAGFVSGNFFLEDGWRDDSPSRVNQVFGKAEWRNDKVQLGLSMLYAGNKLTGNGLLPTQMVDQNPKQVYTSPDESKNDLLQFQLSGIWDVSDTFNVTGQLYNRKSKRKTHTSDVNENFGGSEARPGQATTRDPNRQLLQGLQDINRDGLPDYNDYAFNVAADALGFALDVNGNAAQIDDGSGNYIDNPAFDINNLAYGSNFSTQAHANQAQVPANDGSGDLVLNWTADPRFAVDSANNFSQPSVIPNAFNATLPQYYSNLVHFIFNNRGAVITTNGMFAVNAGITQVSTINHPGNGGSTYAYTLGTQGTSGLNQFTDANGFFHNHIELTPINAASVPQLTGLAGLYNEVVLVPAFNDANGLPIYRDGKYGQLVGGSESGYIEGTPTAIFNDTQIDQIGRGGAVQFNWNLDQHKFMVGASLDTSDSTYASKQYLGFLDANRHGYTDPLNLGWEYYANNAAHGFALNDFAGDSTTKSVYASETWTPIKTLNITAAARFNHTVVNNKLDVNKLNSFGDVNRIYNLLNATALCTDNNNDGVVEASECPTGLDAYIVPFDPIYGYMQDGQNMVGMQAGEKERFKYRSFNPSLGVTWQAREYLNLYGNWSRGARTPTTIELGCAYDATPILQGYDPNTGEPITIPRSILEQRNCSLPGAMSGDPYLKQVRSTSYELGGRGWLSPDIEWNASVYRTDLKDDIYMVAVSGTSSFFQNIGDTRRQGLEMGFKGKAGKAHFGINYAMTDATFQSTLNLASPHNSSAGNVYDYLPDNSNVEQGTYQKIKVNPGDRMPGVPLHNLNANFSYELTNKWTVGLNAVMHSSAFVRGNENNKHKAGPATPLNLCNINPLPGCDAIARADFGSGKTAGYTVFNFHTSYKFNPEWTLGVQINNIFDKEYASAGRLGLNAFSSGPKGAIGASGFNYNSSEWQGTSFLGTGAPRAAWLTLSYEFAPDKK